MRRLLAPLLLGLGVALLAIAACEDDSVYRSGDAPPSGLVDGGGGAAAGDDGGND